jgi:hypothetical protein
VVTGSLLLLHASSKEVQGRKRRQQITSLVKQIDTT